MNLIKKYKYELSIFFILVFELIIYAPTPSAMHTYCATPYALSYELGFGTKLFIGTIVTQIANIFNDGFISYNLVYCFVFFFVLLIAALIAWFIGNSIKTSNNTNMTGLLSVIFLASPASFSYLFYWGNYGRMDTYLIGFVLLSILFINKGRLKYFIPVLSIEGIATHQFYSVSFFPLVFMVMLYHIYKENYSKRSIIFVAANVLIVFITFIAFQFCSNLVLFDDYMSLYNYIAPKTNLPFHAEMIRMEYFASLKDNLVEYNLMDINERIAKTIIVLAMLTPVHLMFFSIWQNAKKAAESKYLKVFFTLMMILPLAILPYIAIACDWGRGLAAAYFIQFIMVLYLSKENCTAVNIALEKLWGYCKNNVVLIGLMIVYLCALGKFQAANVLETAALVYKWIANLAGMIVSIFR